MDIGIFLRGFEDVDFETALAIVSNLGVTLVEIPVHKDAPHFTLDDLVKEEIRTYLKKLLERYRLGISALDIHRESQLVLGPHGRLTEHFYKGSQEEQIAYGIERAKQAAKIAALLEVPVIVGYCGCPDFSAFHPWPRADIWDSYRQVFMERWNNIMDFYKREGVKFAHEINLQQYIYNTEMALSALNWLNSHQSWGYNLDPAHFLQLGLDIGTFVKNLGDRIYYVHAHDGEFLRDRLLYSGWLVSGDFRRPNRAFRFRIPGRGMTSWQTLISDLKTVKYNGVTSIEFDDPTIGRDEGIKEAIEFLKPLIS